MLLQEDFEDDSEKEKSTENDETEKATLSLKPKLKTATDNDNSNILDLLDLSLNEPSESDCLLDAFNNDELSLDGQMAAASTSSLSNILAFDILKKIQGTSNSTSDANKKSDKKQIMKISDKKQAAWFDLFADLDPLANPINMEKKIAGLNQNCLDA